MGYCTWEEFVNTAKSRGFSLGALVSSHRLCGKILFSRPILDPDFIVRKIMRK